MAAIQRIAFNARKSIEKADDNKKIV